MYFTLIELERIHKCPMIVKDAFTGLYFHVFKKDPDTSSLYEVKPLREETHKPELGTPTNLVYGGYSRWLYIKKPTADGISPEEQKKAVELQRKRTNDQLAKGIRHSDRMKNMSRRTEDKRPSEPGKVIPFKPKSKE